MAAVEVYKERKAVLMATEGLSDTDAMTQVFVEHGNYYFYYHFKYFYHYVLYFINNIIVITIYYYLLCCYYLYFIMIFTIIDFY